MAKLTEPFQNTPPALRKAEDTAPPAAGPASTDLLSQLFREQKLTFSDYLSVLELLRKDGQRPTADTIRQALVKIGSKNPTPPPPSPLRPAPAPARSMPPAGQASTPARVSNPPSRTSAADLSRERSTLHSALESARAREIQLQSKLAKTSRQAQQLPLLEQELVRHRATTAELRQREAGLRAQLAQAQAGSQRVDSLQRELALRQADLKRTQDAEQTLRSQLEEARAKASLVESLQRDLAGQRVAAERAREQALRLSADLAGARIRLSEAESIASELNEARQSLDQLRDRENTLQSQLLEAASRAGHADSLKQELASRQSELSAAFEREAAIVAELETYKERAAYVSTLEHQIADQTARLEEAANQERRLRGELERASDSSEIQHELDSQRTIAENALEQTKAIESQLADALDHAALVQPLERDLSEHRSALQEARQREDSLKHQLQDLQNKVDETAQLHTRISELKRAIAEAGEREADLETRFEEARIDAILVHSTEQQLSEQRSALAAALARQDELAAQLDSALEAAARATALERQLAAERAGHEQTRDRGRLALGQLEALHRNTITGFEQRLGAAQTLLSEAHQRESSLQSDLTQAREALSALEPLKGEVASLRESLALASAQEEILNERLSVSSAQLAEAAEREQALQDQLARAAEGADATAALETRIASLSADLESFRGQKQDLEARLLSAQASADESAASLQERLQHAETDLASTRGDLAAAAQREQDLRGLAGHSAHTATRIAELERQLITERAALEDSRRREQFFEFRNSVPLTPAETLRGLVSQLPRLLVKHGGITAAASIVAVAIFAGFSFLTPSGFFGVIDAPLISVESPVTGSVLSTTVEPGRMIARDELLVTIKNARLDRGGLWEAQEALAAAEKALKRLESEKQLLIDAAASPITAADGSSPDAPVDPDHVTLPPADAARSAELAMLITRTRAQVEAAKAAATTEESRLDRLSTAEVRSPTTGLVQNVRVSRGSDVYSGTVLCDIVDSSKAFVESAAPAKRAARLRAGQPVEIEFEKSGKSISGTISSIGNSGESDQLRTAASLSKSSADAVSINVALDPAALTRLFGSQIQIGRGVRVYLK